MFFDPDEGHQFFRRRLPTILAVLVGRDGGNATADRRLATSITGARALARRKVQER